MSYKRVIPRISHWHEHRIHQSISVILGYDTRSIGSARHHSDRPNNEQIDLTLDFADRADYEHCVCAIGAIRQQRPDQDEAEL